MSENLSQPANLGKWIATATERLRQADIDTARLDVLVLLSDELKRDKSWLLAHAEHKLSSEQQMRLDEKIAKRLQRQPLAYIRGYQEFYGRNFVVTPAVLIPRPETETLIELLLTLPKKPADKLIDVGTGSGIIAITAKLEMPELAVYASDIDTSALQIAQKNAAHNNAPITFFQQDLLDAPPTETFDFITANLPYVAKNWRLSPETQFEPATALFADNDGLALIQKLLQQSTRYLAAQGYMLLEADPRQQQRIIEAAAHNYSLRVQKDFILVLQKTR